MRRLLWHGSDDHARVVTARDPEVGVASAAQRDRVLALSDRGRGLESNPEDHGHPRRHAARNAARTVGERRHGPFAHAVGIVVFGSPEQRRTESLAEFDALDGGHGEDGLGDAPVKPLEEWSAEFDGQARDHALDRSANAVGLLARGLDLGRHGGGRFVGERDGRAREALLDRFGRLAHGVVGSVFGRADRAHVGRNADASSCKNLHGDAARDAQRCRQARRKGAAAPHILPAAVPDVGRPVGVRWAGQVGDGRIILRARVAVPDDRRERRPAGAPVDDAAEDLGPVGFPSLRRHAVLLWRPSGHEGLELDRIDGFARRQPVDRHADGGRMALAEDGRPDVPAEIGHDQSS